MIRTFYLDYFQMGHHNLSGTLHIIRKHPSGFCEAPETAEYVLFKSGHGGGNGNVKANRSKCRGNCEM